jgi:hypothetical protein
MRSEERLALDSELRPTVKFAVSDCTIVFLPEAAYIPKAISISGPGEHQDDGVH